MELFSYRSLNQLKEAGGGERIERQIAHLVQDEQPRLDQQRQAFFQLVLVAGTLELLDQVLHGDEVERVTRHDRFRSKRDTEMRLAHARRPEQQHVLLALEEGKRGQLPQLALIDRRLKVRSNWSRPLL